MLGDAVLSSSSMLRKRSEREEKGSAAETVTKGGIMLPEKSQGKVLQATVVAVGSGSKGKGEEIEPVSVKVGDKVLLPEYGDTKVVLDDKDSFLLRDGDILG
ncbi:PREDICTED: 10 kDa heat shock protein, mitochondrial-like [Odobenus rosmarus divergens]|uniref:10 kDa heat shock protein, mitochondrial n=1 Tax=Odobenus rosmarus divergens TaxID=9708 RepID=A0A9B0G349_ODORO